MQIIFNEEEMDKVCYVGIAGKSFTIDADAYDRLDAYLNEFRGKLSPEERAESMEDVENRVSELLHQYQSESGKEVVALWMVNDVISKIGLPDGSEMGDTFTYADGESGREKTGSREQSQKTCEKRIMRDPDNQMLGGVCSGLALYVGVDVVIMRLVVVLIMFAGGFGILAYIVLWIVIPLASTPEEKCRMRGIPLTSENLNRFRTW